MELSVVKKIVRNLTEAGIARRAAAHRAVLDGVVAKMHADYMKPMSLHAVGELFERRGLFVRPFKQIPRQANGSPVPYVPFTDEQLGAMIARTPRLAVPKELKFEWRSWSMARRCEFIAQLRAHLKSPNDAPTGPYSSNVEAFAYGHAKAHAIAEDVNRGKDSRQLSQRIKVVCQGVIYDGQLWFWSRTCGCGYCLGVWTKEDGRPMLHHVLWEKHNGRSVPRGHVVRMADRNKNNLAPENLVLATRNDVARENQAGALLRKSRERTQLILNRSQNPSRHDLSDALLSSAR